MSIPKCKHSKIDVFRRCKACGAVVDILTKRNKYGNRRTDGFQSAHEAKRYKDLKLHEHSGLIDDLECQVPFDLAVNGVHITRYVADYRYKRIVIGQIARRAVVEDAKPNRKGFKKTAAYRLFEIKKRLMKAIWNIDVVEV